MQEAERRAARKLVWWGRLRLVRLRRWRRMQQTLRDGVDTRRRSEALQRDISAFEEAEQRQPPSLQSKAGVKKRRRKIVVGDVFLRA